MFVLNQRLMTGAAVCFGLCGAASGQLVKHLVYGPNADDQYGWATAVLGDLNGDGFEEYAIGAPHDDTAGNNAGAVYVYNGMDGALLAKLTGPAANSAFGTSISTIGDVTGDGVAEFAVGSPDADRAGVVDCGMIELVNGATFVKTRTITGSNTSGHLGISLALVGDVNLDGAPDFIAGEYGADTAIVYDGTNGRRIYATAGQSASSFGFDVCGAGDIDGDTVPDYLVGAPNELVFVVGRVGAVHAYSGATGIELPGLIVGTSVSSQFGISVSLIGDVNGDGFAEAAVGAPYDDFNGTDSGRVEVIDLHHQTSLYSVYGAAANDGFGYVVAGIGSPPNTLADLNVDAIPDFAASAPYSGSGTDYLAIYSGKDGTLLARYTNSNATASFGLSIACGSNISYDALGLPDLSLDLVVGDPNDSSSGAMTGFAFVNQGAPAWAQTNFAGWPGTLGVPDLTTADEPVVGTSITIDLENSLGSTTTGVLLYGLFTANIPTRKSGTYYLYPLGSVLVSVPANGLALAVDIEDDPALYNASIHVQALELDPGASKGLSFSPLLTLHLGYAYP